mmetsp:Transcript_51908/g.110919  ORF Transcript_51908/g.110919 Transcript_51908/m.110919 type:complete len:489 (+) Transcript_51908:135-1601(+)
MSELPEEPAIPTSPVSSQNSFALAEKEQAALQRSTTTFGGREPYAIEVWYLTHLRRHQNRMKEGKHHPYPRMKRLVTSAGFEWATALLIITNCIAIGWQAEQINAEGIILMVNAALEHLFTFLFSLELILRVLCYGWTWLCRRENHLDVFLVTLSVLVTWVLGTLDAAGVFSLDFVSVLRKLTVLRTLRLIKLAHRVRMRPEFKEMWALLKGLTESGETLFWTYIMVSCVLYFFAIMATSLIGKQEAFKDSEIAQECFGDVVMSMLTLFQVMTLDSWTGILRPLMKVQAWLVIFFVVFISIADFVLMNLITAVIVEHAFSSAKDEEKELAARMERQKDQELEELKSFFNSIDIDGSGCLTREEFFGAAKNPKLRRKLRHLNIMSKDLDDIWEILADEDGQLGVEEFVTGIRRLRGEARAKDILRLYREVRILETSINMMQYSMDTAKDRMNYVREQLQRARGDMVAVRRTMQRATEAVKLASKTQPLS